MNSLEGIWLAPKGVKIADFIICGAMKSGTTTLRSMLNLHPDIYIPPREINFFDLDNCIEHPDFNSFDGTCWHKHNFTENPQHYWAWYSQQFSESKPHQMLGEDSTTYLASPLTAKRLAMQNKKIKLIIMLRQPTKRAYSNYWHLVRTGRAFYSFENTLRINPSSVLSRSMYLTQIKNILKYIPKDQVKFILFENFISSKEEQVASICEFLELEHSKLPDNYEGVHRNVSRYPKWVFLQLLKNKLFPLAGNLGYLNHFDIAVSKQDQLLKAINGIHRRINPLTIDKPEILNVKTKEFLDDMFKRELEGINEVIEQDAFSVWFN